MKRQSEEYKRPLESRERVDRVDPNKEAFKKVAEELRHKETQQKEKISLQSLGREEDRKTPKKENIASLKEALSQVINKPKTENVVKEVKDKITTPIDSSVKPVVESHQKKEVPEDVLRELLQMEDGKSKQ